MPGGWNSSYIKIKFLTILPGLPKDEKGCQKCKKEQEEETGEAEEMWPDGPHHMQVGTGGAHKVSAECAGHSVLEEGAIYSCYLQSSLCQPVHPPPKDDPWFHDEGVEKK